ncbi:MAG: hypothetical protein GOVbin1709_60 [Prokaryotic dsDNA virus sp.]|nr:MAG: hypothetical protein GOVbin1709_60 [Prokaryotic dsDNA virus sp.]|tara:strand:+ start:9845 stop:10096 length:252 start_codon:yes stop_codon:yes gene_type:complete
MKKQTKKKKQLFGNDRGPHDRFMPDIEEVILAEGPNKKRLQKGVNETMEKHQFVPLSPMYYNKSSKTFTQVMARFRKIINILI